MLTGLAGVLAAAVLATTGTQAPAPSTELIASNAAKPVVVADARPLRAPGPAVPRDEAAARAADAELSMRLLNRLMEGGYLAKGCMAIAANDSSIRIEGLVGRKSDVTAIERLIAAEPGVSQITNRLKTGSCPRNK